MFAMIVKEGLMMKVALCGKMASGKTTMALKLGDRFGFKRFSLAKGVKDFGNFLFDIPEGHKDRVAYQKVGDGGRNLLYAEIWIDVMLKSVSNSECSNAVVDDVRYLNEVENLKKEGWKIIKIDIEEPQQIERLKKTYPNDWETHVSARNHPSELEIDTIPESMFDLVVKASDDEKYEIVFDFLNDSVHNLRQTLQ